MEENGNSTFISRVKEAPLFSNRKITLGFGALLMCVALTVACSFFPYVLDPSRIGTKEFWSDEIVIIVLSVYALIDLMYMAKAYNAADSRSELARANVVFVETVSKIKHRRAFDQWVREIKEPADQKAKDLHYMKQAGLDDERLLMLSIDQIKGLEGKAQNYDIHDRDGVLVKTHEWFPALTKAQVKVMLEIKQGRTAIRFVPSQTYLQSKTVRRSLTESEIAYAQEKHDTVTMTAAIAIKVSQSVLLAMILGSFVRDASAGDTAVADAVLKLVSRLFSISINSVFGWNLGCKINDDDAIFVRNKVSVMQEYISDVESGLFKVLSASELGKKEFAEQVKREAAQVLKKKEDGPVLLENSSEKNVIYAGKGE